MILYGSTFSPYVRKCVAFAAEKGMEMEVVAVGLGDVNPDFRVASPFGKMPGFKDEDYCLADSSAIVQYLEAKQPEPNLIPTEARARGRAIWWDEWADTILMNTGRKLFFNRVVAPRFLQRQGNAEEADTAEREELPALLDYLEGQLPDSGFLVEDRLTLADISVATILVNLRHAGHLLDLERHPRVAAFRDAILSRPSFAEVVARETVFLSR